MPDAERGRGVELVVFDCDGVLVDSERLAVRVESRLVTSLGWPLSEAEIARRFLGRSEAFMVDAVESAIGRAVPEWSARYEHALYDAFERELAPVDGVVTALDALEGAGVATCVASSGSHDKMRVTLGITGLRGRFEGRIFSASEVDNAKPAPDLFLHAAARMGVAPGRCAVVEDSPAGAAAAQAAGMACFAYAGGLLAADAFEGTGAHVFADMRALPGLLGTGVV